jgi:hypothetical protein
VLDQMVQGKTKMLSTKQTCEETLWTNIDPSIFLCPHAQFLQIKDDQNSTCITLDKPCELKMGFNTIFFQLITLIVTRRNRRNRNTNDT